MSTSRPWPFEVVAVAAVTTGLLFATRSHVLTQPPVWDGAMSVAPAAITLAESGFDLPALLSMPGYSEGGPNTHSTSLFTMLMALVILAMGSLRDALPVLHAITFAIAGLYAAGVFRIVQRALGRTYLGVSAALLSILYPPTVVQASDIYLDLPMSMAVIWAVALLLDDRVGLSVAVACLAIAIKPTGVIALAPILYYVWHNRPRSVRFIMGAAIPPISLAIAAVWFQRASSGALQASPIERIITTASQSAWYLVRNPALCVLFASLVLTLVLYIAASRRQKLLAIPASQAIEVLLIGIGAIFAFFAFNPLVTNGFPLLSRYTVLLAPLLVATVICLASSVGRRFVWLVCAILAVGFAVTLHSPGSVRSPNFYSISERDLSYELHLQVQMKSFRHLAHLSYSMPILTDRFTHYRFEYPQLAWLDDRGPVETDRIPVSTTDQVPNLDELPDRFAFLFEQVYLGGEVLDRIWSEAVGSVDYTVQRTDFSAGNFRNYVVIVTRR